MTSGIGLYGAVFTSDPVAVFGEFLINLRNAALRLNGSIPERAPLLSPAIHRDPGLELNHISQRSNCPSNNQKFVRYAS